MGFAMMDFSKFNEPIEKYKDRFGLSKKERRKITKNKKKIKKQKKRQK